MVAAGCSGGWWCPSGCPSGCVVVHATAELFGQMSQRTHIVSITLYTFEVSSDLLLPYQRLEVYFMYAKSFKLYGFISLSAGVAVCICVR